MLLILVFISLVVALIYYGTYNRNYWKNRGVVQVNGLLSKFIWSNRSISEIYKDLYIEYIKDCYVGVFFGIKPALIIKDVRDVQFVMQGNFENFYSRGIDTNPNDILADNVLFMGDYRRWKLLRHKLSPIFTSLKIKNMFYIMERCARDFVKFVDSDEYVPGNTFNALYTYTTACIGATLFGIDTQTKNTMESPFLEMTRESIEPSLIGNLKFTLASLSPTLFNLFNLKQFGKYEEFFIGTVKRVFEKRRNDKQKRHDFVDLCLELQKQGTMKDPVTGYEIEATDEVLAAQAFFFFLAGVDTSATVMHFALLELASNRDIKNKVHEEIDRVFNECDEKLNYDDIDKLEYLDMVLSETMRKYPPIGAIQRSCAKSTALPVGQVKVIKDDIIVIPIFALHRDEMLYPNPDVFDPERFSPENISKIVKFSYLPFGEGNRMCLGTRFARVQVKSGLAWLLRKYTLKEEKYEPRSFAPSFFGLRDSKANFKLISRS
ncbi:probable cytochrome P450 6a17 [Vanessa tameamea]|uniref:unspecific monooxygenase n=1 Tax=Vanessa tameamea TaxID=334116 RepID=A0A8B8HIV4_VANTA